MKVLIWGCGRVGGSIAKSIVSSNHSDESVQVDGYDLNTVFQSTPVTELGCYKSIYHQKPDSDSLAQYDIIFLCTPIDAFEEIAGYLKEKINPNTEVVDVGSRKTQSVEIISRHLASNYFPIHPMVGGPALNSKDEASLAADYEKFSDQFLKQKIVFTFPDSRTCKGIVTQKLLSNMGSRLVNTTTEEHDRTCALTSHLPQALAAIFWHAMATSSISAQDKAFEFTSQKILDPMWLPIFLNNDFIAQRLKEFKSELQNLKKFHLNDSFFSNKQLSEPTESKALEAFIVKTIENLKDACDSPIRDNACGLGYQRFTKAESSKLEEYVAQANQKSLALLLNKFTASIDAFLSVQGNLSPLKKYLETAHNRFEQKNEVKNEAIPQSR